MLTEQHVPGWDRMTRQGIEQAVLDVILITNSGRVAVDVSVAEAPSADNATARARARADGAVAREVAAALETGGRMGREFQ
eukprot:5599460-Pyramimonas_sp.AAC.1